MRLGPTLLTAVIVSTFLLSPAHHVAHEQTQVQISTLDRKIAARPLDAGLYMQRGEMHRILGNWDLARRDYERSLWLDPGLSAVHLCEGRLWMDEGLPGRALVALDRYIAAHPEDPAGRTMRARALARLEQHADAAAEFGQAIALENARGRRPQPDVYLGMARALVATGDDQRPRALGVLEEGSTRLSRPVALEIEALEIERALGRTDAALARLDRLAATAARQEVWLVRRAEVLEQAGRRAEAMQSWRDASAAIDRLPASRRHSAAIVRMRITVSEALSRLEGASSMPPVAP